jgi:hypothetical protein
VVGHLPIAAAVLHQMRTMNAIALLHWSPPNHPPSTVDDRHSSPRVSGVAAARNCATFSVLFTRTRERGAGVRARLVSCLLLLLVSFSSLSPASPSVKSDG